MRVVSLVPSLTQTLFDLGLSSSEIVGRTPWCIHPATEVEQVMVVELRLLTWEKLGNSILI